MLLISLPHSINDYEYFFCHWSGDLLYHKNKEYETDKIPVKLKIALEACDQPYNLKCLKKASKKSNLNLSKKIIFVSRIMVFLCRFSFFIAKRYADFKFDYFLDSSQSIQYFNSISPQNCLNDLCLPRTLFSAKTSKAFTKNGVILIGVFLPSRAMHAWIIENGSQPDPTDDIWHLYRPIAAIC